jgi:hypothetical protein
MVLPSEVGDEKSDTIKPIKTPKMTIDVFNSRTERSTVFAQAGNIAIGIAGGVLALRYPTKSFLSSSIFSLKTRTLSIIFKEFSKIIFE